MTRPSIETIAIPRLRRCAAPLGMTGLVLGAVVAGPALGQASGAPPVDITMTVRPIRSGGSEVAAIAVRTEIRGSLDRAASAFSVRTPITYAGVRHIADRVDSLVVRDATGVLAIRVEDDATNPAGFPYYRH